MKPLRPYQEQAVQAIFDYWTDGGGSPAVEMATGTGKSLVIAKLVQDVVKQYDLRVLMLVHVRELVRQNALELLGEWPDAPIGINSAGLGRRDRHHKVLFASIQSVYREDGYSLGPRDLVLIDEAHLVPHAGEGMYRTLLDKLRDRVPDLRCVGFTATPYRLGSGRIDRGDGRLFDEIVYSYDIGRGVDDGYLAPLVARSTMTKISVDGVGRRGGEFIESELAKVVSDANLVRQAAEEIVTLGADRRSWIVFCVDVAHTGVVAHELRRLAITCAIITGDTPKGERDSSIARFKAGEIRCLVSVNVLSIGFNAPGVDLIALLRPTLSTGLYVQQLGRGTRCVGPDIAASVAAGKSDCLVLDFAGNVRRHGPVDAISIEPRDKAGNNKDEDKVGTVKPDDVKAKTCPVCGTYTAPHAVRCANVNCDHEWEPPKPKHEAKPDQDVVILARRADGPVFKDVRETTFNEHRKPLKPPTLRVTYYVGLNSTYSEWICFEHSGFARSKAVAWWRAMGAEEPVPASISEALFRQDELARVIGVAVKQDGEFWRITHHCVVMSDGMIVRINEWLKPSIEQDAPLMPAADLVEARDLVDEDIPF